MVVLCWRHCFSALDSRLKKITNFRRISHSLWFLFSVKFEVQQLGFLWPSGRGTNASNEPMFSSQKILILVGEVATEATRGRILDDISRFCAKNAKCVWTAPARSD